MTGEELVLRCPRCGLKLWPRPWFQANVCPRCIAYASVSIKLVGAETPGNRAPATGGVGGFADGISPRE
jgi:hypothetical protein